MDRPRIVVLSDQALFRQGLEELLRSYGCTNVGCYASSEELLADARQHTPDLLFVDLDHECEDVRSLSQSLRRALPDTHIVVIGSALRQGATDAPLDGGLETPRADRAALIAALRTIGPHRPSLEVRRQRRIWSTITPRQRDVLRWLATGADNRSIGRKLRIGQRAVKAHVSALLDTFGFANRTQLALMADHAGLRPPRSRARA